MLASVSETLPTLPPSWNVFATSLHLPTFYPPFQVHTEPLTPVKLLEAALFDVGVAQPRPTANSNNNTDDCNKYRLWGADSQGY